jgi:prepilin-type N-terminal cleavage/methylation domain-containing protein
VAAAPMGGGIVNRRAGFSLAEILVALAVGGVVLAGVVGMIRGASRSVVDQTRRSESAEVLRTVWSVLDEELSAGVPGRDWTLEGEQAVVLRAYRGVARVCGPGDEAGTWAVAWRGHRAPVPDRDSLLVLRADGRWDPTPLLEERSGGPCPLEPGEAAGRWRPGGDLAAEPGGVPVLFRYFERGRYSLEDGAFRYRRGAGGRQPLTPERVEPGSRFLSGEDGPRVLLELDPGGWVEWRLPMGMGKPPGEGGS